MDLTKLIGGVAISLLVLLVLAQGKMYLDRAFDQKRPLRVFSERFTDNYIAQGKVYIAEKCGPEKFYNEGKFRFNCELSQGGDVIIKQFLGEELVDSQVVSF